MTIKWFADVRNVDSSTVGGKGASLGELTHMGVPVPPGFVVTSDEFVKVLGELDIQSQIDNLLEKTDHTSSDAISAVSVKIRKLVETVVLPPSLQDEITKAFSKLGAEYVAVRSSATCEDGSDAAWAGQLETFLNTSGEQLIDRIRSCWASLFTPRAISYRYEKGFENKAISVAVVVQAMVDSEKSGVAFSVHPVSQDPNQIIIEAGFGLGEAVVSGQITPDAYVIEKDSGKIIEERVNTQRKQMVKNDQGESEWIEVDEASGSAQVLNQEQIKALSEVVMKIEDGYGLPIDVEWAVVGDEIFITQARPITSLSEDGSVAYLAAWEKIISRNIPLFGWSSGARYEHDGLSIGPVHWKRNRELIVKLDTPQAFVYFDANDFFVSNIQDVVAEINPAFELALDQEIVFVGDVVKAQPAKTKKELLKLIDLHERSFGVMLMGLDLVMEMHQVLAGKIKLNPALERAIFLPPSKTAIQRENGKMLEIKKSYQSAEEVPADVLTELVEQYGFLHQDYMGSAWTGDDYLKSIFSLSSDGEQEPDMAIPTVGEYESWLISVIQKTTFVYEEGRNAMVRAVWAILESEGVHGVSRSNLLHMTANEFREVIISDAKVDSHVGDRANTFALYFDKGETQILSKKEEIEKLVKEQGIILHHNAESTEVLNGAVANPGIAQGPVRLVFTQEQADGLQEGEVLVAPMTAVEFLAGIRKAAAIITDEGGVICHAAIVSRELNIPCVIGTGNATDVLADGDIVHVNAGTGKITIIEKK